MASEVVRPISIYPSDHPYSSNQAGLCAAIPAVRCTALATYVRGPIGCHRLRTIVAALLARVLPQWRTEGLSMFPAPVAIEMAGPGNISIEASHASKESIQITCLASTKPGCFRSMINCGSPQLFNLVSPNIYPQFLWITLCVMHL